MIKNQKYIYKHKKTGKVVVTHEKLNARQYKLVKTIELGIGNLINNK